MPAYGEGFASVYDTHWGDFARTVSPLVVTYLRAARPGVELHVLDLGCGTGITAAALEQAGCLVTGVDGSAAMLEVARSRTSDRTRLVQGPLDEPPPGPYDVVLCLFDTLNHLGLDGFRTLASAAAKVARPQAAFLFDITTAAALRTWSGTTVLPGDPPVTVAARCDPHGEWAEMTVSAVGPSGERWLDVQREVRLDPAAVATTLDEAGWHGLRWSTYDDLSAPVDPESVRRAVGICVRDAGTPRRPQG